MSNEWRWEAALILRDTPFEKIEEHYPDEVDLYSEKDELGDDEYPRYFEHGLESEDGDEWVTIMSFDQELKPGCGMPPEPVSAAKARELIEKVLPGTRVDWGRVYVER